MRFHSRQAAEDFGFEIIATYDDGMDGSRTVLYRWKRTGWFASACGEKNIYRSDDIWIGSAYHSSNGSRIYTLDPDGDAKLRKIIRAAA